MTAVADSPMFGHPRKRKPVKDVSEPEPVKEVCRAEGSKVDAFLRQAGFRIHGRPASGWPTWERGKRVYGEAVAFRLAMEEKESVSSPKN